jgi:hypothetical protein
MTLNYKQWATWFWLVVLCLLLAGVICALADIAKADRPGETLEFLGHFRDVNGVAAVPDTGKFIVFVNGAPYDSSAELTDLSGYRSYRTLQYQWVIPSLDDSSHVSCVFRGSDTGGIVKDEFLMSPVCVLIQPHMGDSASAELLAQLSANLELAEPVVASEVWQPVKVDSFATNAYTELNANLDLANPVSIDDVQAGALSDMNSGLNLALPVSVDDVTSSALTDLNTGLDLSGVSIDEVAAGAIEDMNDTSTGLDLVTVASEVWAPVKVDSTAANFITELNAGLDLANAVTVDDVAAGAISDLNTGLDLANAVIASEVWAPVKVDSFATNAFTELNANLDLANAVIASEVWAPVRVDSTTANFITELNDGLTIDVADTVQVYGFTTAGYYYLNENLELDAGSIDIDSVAVTSFTAEAVASFNNFTATAQTAVIDSSDAGGIYYANGNKVTDARVYATSDSGSWGTPFYMTRSTAGQYKLAVPKAAGDTLTYYISAYYPGTWAKTWVPVEVIGD